MHQNTRLRPTRHPLLITTFALAVTTSMAMPVAAEHRMPENGATASAVRVADAHPYRHCHNLPRRTYCHKQDRLPQNWPPNTDTPHQGEVEENRPCLRGEPGCGSRRSYGHG